MLNLIREATVGQAIRFIFRNRLLQYPEERPDFQFSIQYVSQLKNDEKFDFRDQNYSHPVVPIPPPAEDDSTAEFGAVQDVDEELEALGMVKSMGSVRSAPYTNERLRAEQELDLERSRTIPIIPQKTLDGVVLVDWYTTDDPENPQIGRIPGNASSSLSSVRTLGPSTVQARSMLPLQRELWNTSMSVQLLQPPAYRSTFLLMALETLYSPP
jgi:hypothetical protein